MLKIFFFQEKKSAQLAHLNSCQEKDNDKLAKMTTPVPKN